MNVLNASNTERFGYEYQGFADYVYNFYKDFPYYCSKGKPFTFWEVERAVKRYYKNIKEFDSIDRENVKFVIEAYRQLNPEHSYPKVDLFRATYQSMQHQQSIRKEQNGNYHNT
jgi:hypothetical protein